MTFENAFCCWALTPMTAPTPFPVAESITPLPAIVIGRLPRSMALFVPPIEIQCRTIGNS